MSLNDSAQIKMDAGKLFESPLARPAPFRPPS